MRWAYTAPQIVTAIQTGTTYFNVHTVNFPNGEIRGFLTLVNGSQNPPTPVADPGYTDDHTTDAGAARFLNQAAYGASRRTWRMSNRTATPSTTSP